VSSAALALALAAAFLHAGWNLLLARANDVQAATAVMLGVSTVALAPIAAFTWDVDRGVVPWAVGSAAFELAYFALLAYAYERAAVSVVYPVARGLAPVLVLVVGIASASAGEAIGVVLVALGIVLVRGLQHPDRRGVGLGAVIAVCIAGYTVLDDHGIEHADAISYFVLVIGIPGLVYLASIWRRRGRDALRSELKPVTVAAAAAATLAYLLVLLALDIGNAAPVAAVRETSVVIVVALAAIFLHEPVGRGRLAGAVLVAAGVALLSF
jgi:drug/metabolite transporter (DMT)-like permease